MNIYVYTPYGFDNEPKILDIMNYFGVKNFYRDNVDDKEIIKNWKESDWLPDEYRHNTLVFVKHHTRFINIPDDRKKYPMNELIDEVNVFHNRSASETLTIAPKLLKITLETSFYVPVDETNICYSVELSEDVRTTMVVQEFGQAVEEAKQMVGACMNESNKTLVVLEND